MKLIFIISCLTVVVAEPPALNCVYSLAMFSLRYQCNLTINNPDGLNNFTEIGGNHLEGFTNADVEEVEVFRDRYSVSTNVPSIICHKFPNAYYLSLENIGLNQIGDNDFDGCSRLTILNFGFNWITSISENAFIKLPNLQSISMNDNNLTTLPENVFANQQDIRGLAIERNPIDDIPVDLFTPLQNLQSVSIFGTNIEEINIRWFSHINLERLFMSRNRITTIPHTFEGLELLRQLGLSFNAISEIPFGAFTELSNLESLSLEGNNLTELQPDSFRGLGKLSSLFIGSNPIETIYEGAFRGLDNLTELYLNSCRLRQVHSKYFENIKRLSNLELSRNEIEELPEGVFAEFKLQRLSLGNNRLKTLRRNSFGSLTDLSWLVADGTAMNALDRTIIDDAVNLNVLFMLSMCTMLSVTDFLINRNQYLSQIQGCFENYENMFDTTTEGDGEFSLFEASQQGVFMRINATNEIQIILIPLNFTAGRMIEIFIGTTNNTVSVIRMNGKNVVTVPTPNIIARHQSKDFIIQWSNERIRVFSSTTTFPYFPFMEYSVQDFFPVNLYGLRSVETKAFWSVQPLLPWHWR